MFEELNAHRLAVQENIKKAFEVGFTGNEDLEKAHQVGDMHPNGKWVWTEYKPGRFDWRPLKSRGGVDRTPKKGDEGGSNGGNSGGDDKKPKKPEMKQETGGEDKKKIAGVSDIAVKKYLTRSQKNKLATKIEDEEIKPVLKETHNDSDKFREAMYQTYKKHANDGIYRGVNDFTYWVGGGFMDSGSSIRVKEYIKGRERGEDEKKAKESMKRNWKIITGKEWVDPDA